MNHTWITISQWESDELTLLGNGMAVSVNELNSQIIQPWNLSQHLGSTHLYMHCTHQSQHTFFSRLFGGLCLRRTARE